MQIITYIRLGLEVYVQYCQNSGWSVWCMMGSLKSLKGGEDKLSIWGNVERINHTEGTACAKI